MRPQIFTKMILVLAAMAIAVPQTVFAKRKAPEKAELTESGEALKAQYAKQMAALKAEITQDMPDVSAEKKSEYIAAREAEKAAKAALGEAQNAHGKIKRAQGLVGHARNHWIKKADRGIASSKAKIAAAKTDAEREAAEKELANWQKNRQDGLDALNERQALLDAALAEEPKLTRALDAAKDVLAKAEARTLKAVDTLKLMPVLSSSALDAKLAKYVVMMEATPHELAAFAQQGKAHKMLVNDLLSDDDLLIQMVVADGAAGGNYPRAMQIYKDIQNVSAKAANGALQRLALAISLEHAEPIGQRNAKAKTNAPETVNPVKRYQHYEDAFLNDELDPAFKDLSVWDYRMVVDGSEPDEILAWGREMLRNYRPDHITMDDYRWRYVALVRTDIRYGSQCNKFDKDELQFFQNILMNGGICGRRAFIGRFILRAFGIPTTARPQRGHAALAHWTPEGWVVCLGGGWGSGWTKGRYNKDLDFLANTQARESRERFMEVKRAQWIGDVLGEKRVFGLLSGDPDFWYGISLYTQRDVIQDSNAVALAAVGEELGEANESDVEYAIATTEITASDRKISVDGKGVISIPAAASSNPEKSTGKIIFMPSVLGGLQMHYSRNGGAQNFEYTFDAPTAGTYALTAKLVTPSWKQMLYVSANGANPVEIVLPHTVGMWESTDPVEVQLKKGKNVLTFSHTFVPEAMARGFSIKEFSLAPVADQVSQL